MRRRLHPTPSRGIVAALVAGLAASAAAEAQNTGNLLANPSFELDWINAKAEKAVINNWEEHGFNQQDLKPDVWSFSASKDPAVPALAWDSSVARTGRYSLRMEIGAGRSVVSQSQNYAGYQGILGHEVFDLKATEGRFSPQATPIPLSAADAPKFFRAVRLTAWCKAESVPEGTRIHVHGRGLSLSFPSGTYDWKKLETAVSGEDLARQFIESLKGAAQGPLPIDWNVVLEVTPPAEAAAGRVWFDDVCAEEDLPATANWTPDPSFEKVGEDGRPAGWSEPQKFHYVPPSWYYVWRSWSHFFTLPRGRPASDSLVVRSGRRSFRFSVLPGDEYACSSPPIEIRQDAARPIEIGVWLKADRIRYFDIRAVDERGVHLNEESFITATANREIGAAYRGCFDWRYFRKICATDHPVQSLRVELCARGFNGLDLDDVGRKATNNQVGNLWWDDLSVTQPAAGGPARDASSATAPPGPEVRVQSVAFGERLYGENEAALVVENAGQQTRTVQARLTLSPPASLGGSAQPAEVQTPSATLQPGGSETLRLPYALQALCPDWQSQYRMTLRLSVDGQPAGETEIFFGTWPEIGRVEIERVYAHPDEAKAQAVWVNFGVTEATLSQVRTLRYDVVRRRDGKTVRSIQVKDFPKALAEFRQKQPLKNWWIDEFHLFLRPLDLSFLPAHPWDRPVRDHLVLLVAEDPLGRDLFKCESVPFGLVLPPEEKLEPIRSVEVKDGALHVNGRPFFLRACLGHGWELEPAPSQRPPWAKPVKVEGQRDSVDFSRTKAYGFNAFFPNVPVELTYADDIWKSNLYMAVWYPKNWFGLAFDETYGAKWKCASAPEEFQAAGRHPSIVMISLTAWEGGMSPEITQDARFLHAQAAFADEVRRLTGRPLFSSGGYSAHRQQYGTMWDIFAPESNWDGPSRVPYTAIHPLRALGKNIMGMDFPNIFSDMAYDLIRFETYEGLIRGQRGFIQIGRFNDNSLYRGLNGELRYLEPFLFAPPSDLPLSAEPVRVETVPGHRQGKPEIALPKVSLMHRTVGRTTCIIATNAQPIRHGDWTWTEDPHYSNRRSHTGDSVFCRLYPDRLLDWHAHGYRDGKPVIYRKGGQILQYVYIPPEADVETLILMVEGDGRWNFNAVWGRFDFKRFHESKVRFRLTFELYRWLWSSFGTKRDTWAEEVYDDLFERHFLREPDFRVIGPLPPKGQWTPLAVPVETLDLAGRVGTGFEFLSKGGRVWWDYTAIEREKEVLVLCDDALGASEQELAQVRFRGLKPGATVRALFEDRVFRADKSGSFIDDFRGENVYDKTWEGMLGDKLMPEAYYGGGYHYNYPKAAVRVYEVK
ncbi:MAG: hypothetical protein HYU36_02665 [Planctomycetes bacterium]|nr:hypothetical protein [Planctomycetota bacterium]